MSPYDAITVARRELASSGMIRLVGDRMQPGEFADDPASRAIAVELATAYNTLSVMQQNMSYSRTSPHSPPPVKPARY